jgi:hypothetical protein
VSYQAPDAADKGRMKLLTVVLPIVMPLLQGQQLGGDSEGAVNKAVGLWLDEALKALPPVALEEGPEGAAALEKLLLAESCFPLHSGGGKEAVAEAGRAPPPEKQRTALLDLLRRHFHSREAMAGALVLIRFGVLQNHSPPTFFSTHPIRSAEMIVLSGGQAVAEHGTHPPIFSPWASIQTSQSFESNPTPRFALLTASFDLHELRSVLTNIPLQTHPHSVLLTLFRSVPYP